MVTEKELRAAMSSVGPNILVKVVDWIATIDDRRVPATIGFFVELASNQVPDLALAPERVLDELSRTNGNIAFCLANDFFCKPTIRLVRPGTFSDFRQLKLDEGCDSLGQIKVPVVPKAAYVTWFSNRVVRVVNRIVKLVPVWVYDGTLGLAAVINSTWKLEVIARTQDSG